ncbi:helix-turn-helix domain-containing protein [Micromonospora sp. WMMD1082]|uniref:ArsR/SmtB family transcription factor n=1 Tax=Micromonospora sp. WMMD1082 TaxID=3016104 RepID=UPI0024180411|nr:helix-turn-helix domain-containing protein [Micromonospora sp. WMMD1082]MDG4792934.1 helix-turn-helix domain-containing protein [Micromonospora sp. WMMD1082]
MTDVEERLAALEAQVGALRERLDGGVPAAEPEGTFWALDGLKQRIPAGSAGAVLYTGTVHLADQQFDWQYGRGVDDLLAGDWADLPATLSALAHPVRLRLLREILGGRQGTGELAGIEELGTTGQLHHHLRQLTAAGWLRSAGRGRYAIPGERVVPLLAILAAAGR